MYFQSDTKSDQDGKPKRKVSVYSKDTYNRVETVTLTNDKPNADQKVFQNNEKLSPIVNPQTHDVHTVVGNKVIDGKYVHTEKQEEQAAKELYKEKVEPIKQ
ncbi:unnamed protein product [Cylicocyclus nassatus]|uniref:Uncharacterized protein n=1 Tax=Cylicocyclus nassatus TaxID=53992 RepID=A0AA36GQ59_CYLNA|nr:unnamed protein product [Cylicocyclus nassatus]